MSLFRIRKALALAALATLGLLIVTADLRFPDGSLQRSAVAIAVLPWSMAFLLARPMALPRSVSNWHSSLRSFSC